MKEIIDALNRRVGWDCVVKSYDGWSLVLSSGSSPDNASPFAILSGVSYLACPMEFSHPLFRLASKEEKAKIEVVLPIDEGDQVVAFEAETMASTLQHTFFIVCQSISLVSNA